MPVLVALALSACGGDPASGVPRVDGTSADGSSVLPPGSLGDVAVTGPDAVGIDAPEPRDVGVDAAPLPDRRVIVGGEDVGGDDVAGDGGAEDVARDGGAGDVTVAVVPADVGSLDTGRDVAAATDVGVDVVAPRDTGPDVVAPVDAGAVPMVPGVARIDAALKATLRAVYLRGLAAGHRAGVFAKIGDSITESESFLTDFGPASGTPSWNLGAYTALDPTRSYFDATLVDATHSSFDRPSLAAVAGWTAGRALEDNAALLRQELAALHPAVALVMLGTADVDASDVATFRTNLTRVVQIALAANTIPVLSTIPDRTDNPTNTAQGPAFNVVIREVAAAQRVPLEDYWTALLPLPRRGLSDDGVHPSLYHQPGGGVEAAYFTPAALAYGYNMRNLVTLATLAHVRAVIFLDGPADP